MSLLVPARRYDQDVPEMIDNPDADARLPHDELKSIRTINRFFGGYATSGKGMRLLLADIKKEEISVLNLGTSSADLPLYLLGLGRRLKRRFRITAVENHPRVLEVAREQASGHPRISIESGNLLSLNYPPGAFDIVILSPTLRHLSREDAIKIIRCVNHFSRIGYLVNDLN